MGVERLSGWREPICARWRDEIELLAVSVGESAAATAESSAGRLKRLAGMRLGESERLLLGRLLRRIRRSGNPLPGFTDFRILIVSNRTTAFFARDIEVAGVARGLQIAAVEAKYDSVRPLALDPAVAPPEGRFDAVLLLVDAYFFASRSELLDTAAEADSLRLVQSEFEQLANGLRSKLNAPVICCTIPCPAEMRISSADASIPGTRLRMTEAVNRAIVRAAEKRDVILFDLNSWGSRIGTADFFDPVRFHEAKLPFSFDANPIVADGLCALIAAMVGRSGRALVLDLDNTIWGGVLADDGLEAVVLGQGSPAGEAFLAVQSLALELRRRGVALAVCSKNDEEIAREPFRSHPDMLLREEHIAAFVANFGDKAVNVANIARMLDLDTSALVFLDDNPAERERIRSSLPFVMVPEIGEDPADFPGMLVASGFFEHLPLTADDTQRAAGYHARALAKELQSLSGDYQDYLRSLEMELSISPFDGVGRARIEQLIRRSNQFNLTTKRYSEIDIAGIEKDPNRIAWQARLKDRFADHGMISVVIADKGSDAWIIDSWIMSCRVLERGVELALMAELARLAAQTGAAALVGTYKPTSRNGLVGNFYDRLGFGLTGCADDGTKSYRLELVRANFPATEMKISHFTPTADQALAES